MVDQHPLPATTFLRDDCLAARAESNGLMRRLAERGMQITITLTTSSDHNDAAKAMPSLREFKWLPAALAESPERTRKGGSFCDDQTTAS